MSTLLRKYVMELLEADLARVPQQLISPSDDADKEESGKADMEAEKQAGVVEFSGVGAVAGFTLPLGMSPQKPHKKSIRQKR
jgi:hypothetical protein